MKQVGLKDARATLSSLLDQAIAGEPVIITRNGRREGVLIGYAEYQRLSRVPSLGWLLANSPLEDGDLERDLSESPERLRPFTEIDIARINALTKDVRVSDDEPIPDVSL